MTELTPEQIEDVVDDTYLTLDDTTRSAARALWIHQHGATAEEYDDADPRDVWPCVQAATAVLAAVRPVIEAEVRAKVAAELSNVAPDVLERMRAAIEDELINRRDRGIGVLCANGLAVRDRDGEPSPVIRISTREAIARVLEDAAARIARGGGRG